jgi:hypothetical protein
LWPAGSAPDKTKLGAAGRRAAATGSGFAQALVEQPHDRIEQIGDSRASEPIER